MRPYSGRERDLSLSLAVMGVYPPEYIHKYTIRSVFGRPNPAPTVGENVIFRLSLTAMGHLRTVKGSPW